MLVCSDAANAPINDLILADNLEKYKSHDHIISDKSLKALSRHTWYLHEGLIPFVLFSSMIQEEEKESMLHYLVQVKNAEVTKRFGALYVNQDLKQVPSFHETHK